MKHGIVIAGGDWDISVEDVTRRMEAGWISIGVDRGISFFLEENLQADYYLGDLDSISPHMIRDIPSERLLQFPPEKNASDLELALEFCMELGLDSVEVYGATGSRWDHTFSNLLSLDRYMQAGIQVILKNRKNQAQALTESLELSRQSIQHFQYLSLLPLSSKGITVSITGVRYPLCKEHLEFGKTRGVSNESIGENIHIELHAGRAILVLSND